MTPEPPEPPDEAPDLAYHRGVQRAAAALAALRHPAAGQTPRTVGYPCSVCGSTGPVTPARLRRVDGEWAFAVWGWACDACLPDTLGDTP